MKQIGSDVYKLKTYGIDVKTDSNPDAHMHNKFMVIDSYIIVTGSFNWASSAVENKKNDQNLMVLRCAELALKYQQYFETLWTKFVSAKLGIQDAKDHVKEQRSHYRGGNRGEIRGGNRHGGGNYRRRQNS